MEFDAAVTAYLNSTYLTRSDNRGYLLNAIDMIARSKEGLSYLYTRSVELERIGIFKGTAWEDPTTLVPSLVKGTLHYGHPNSSLEILSELRILAYANGEFESEHIDRDSAMDFITNVLVLNLEFALRDLSEESLLKMSESEQRKAVNLFSFILKNVDQHLIRDFLAEEIIQICSQRPIVTRRAKELVSLLSGDPSVYSDEGSDQTLLMYANAVYHPTETARLGGSVENYANALKGLTAEQLEAECNGMGQSMAETGLVSACHATLLRFITEEKPDYVPICLALTETGENEWNNHQGMISSLIREIVRPANRQCIYGMARVIDKAMLSNRVVRIGVENIRKIELHPVVEERITSAGNLGSTKVNARQYLLGATLSVLGQPLGVGQGHNPTCQSARGISMWGMHTPGRLLDLIITAASRDKLVMRFENDDLDSSLLGKGLAQKIDYQLDAVSITLVPHLDKIYNEMMKRAGGRWQDPHKWVNPAMYGTWVQLGFASAYDYYTNSILDFRGFVALLYSHFHLDYNGGRRMTYPNPVGIFLTSANGKKVGFHAVALMRIKKDPQDEMRAYFLNPNNEGRQDWGQGILPSVRGHGEHPGESSLPFQQFAARIYAFHFSPKVDALDDRKVPTEIIDSVEKLAKESWGRDYAWLQQPKQWA